MIKIIKEGKKQFQGNCEKCGCVFLYEIADMSGADYVECPCCGQWLYHPEQKPDYLESAEIEVSKRKKLLEDT